MAHCAKEKVAGEAIGPRHQIKVINRPGDTAAPYLPNIHSFFIYLFLSLTWSVRKVLCKEKEELLRKRSRPQRTHISADYLFLLALFSVNLHYVLIHLIMHEVRG